MGIKFKKLLNTAGSAFIGSADVNIKKLTYAGNLESI